MFDDNDDFALTLPLASPIRISTGLELHVTPGHESDDDTLDLIRHIAEHVDRAHNMKRIELELIYFMRHSEDDAAAFGIDDVLENVGWISNFSSHTVADKIRFLRHILPMLSDADIVTAREQLEFYAERVIAPYRDEHGFYQGDSAKKAVAS